MLEIKQLLSILVPFGPVVEYAEVLLIVGRGATFLKVLASLNVLFRSETGPSVNALC